MRECNDIVTIVDVIHQDPYNRSLGMNELKARKQVKVIGEGGMAYLNRDASIYSPMARVGPLLTQHLEVGMQGWMDVPRGR